MKNLKPRIRHKAIDIANALLDDGYEEGLAIAIATAKAEEWDENHPVHEAVSDSSTSSKEKNKASTLSQSSFRECRHSEPISSCKSHNNIHVVPADSGRAFGKTKNPSCCEVCRQKGFLSKSKLMSSGLKLDNNRILFMPSELWIMLNCVLNVLRLVLRKLAMPQH
ncbi:hypothetical protein HUB98_07065 [Paenibacillus barcinonensis]|nr:hypothetical protein HUB98_07065 [Paenibacillus barcinonensis]